MKTEQPYDVVANLVIDVSHMAHRQHHALTHFVTTDGRPAGQVHGSFRNIASLVRSLQPQRVVFCYDRGAPWRKELVPGYKATRRPAGESEIETGYLDRAIAQAEEIRLPPTPLEHPTPAVDAERLLRCFPGLHLSAQGFEADDCAAAFVLGSDLVDPDRGATVLYTGDKDYLQLVDDRRKVCCATTKKQAPKRKGQTAWVQAEDVMEDMGVMPEAVAALKALLGDDSDNVRGLEGGVRPGKKALLKAFAQTQAAQDFLTGAPLQAPELPGWLADCLRVEQQRLVANHEVVNLRLSSAKLLAQGFEPVVQPKGDIPNALGILAEFECESLLEQTYGLFGVLETLSR